MTSFLKIIGALIIGILVGVLWCMNIEEAPKDTTAILEENKKELESQPLIQKLVHDYILETNKGQTDTIIFNNQQSIIIDGRTFYGAKVSVKGNSQNLTGNLYAIEENGKITFVSSNIAPVSMDGTVCTDLINAGFPEDFDDITNACN